jgi:uncharacterized protein DUF4136
MRTRRWLLLATMAAAGCGGYTAPDEVVLGSSVYTQPAPGADFKPLNTYYLDPSLEVWEDGVQKPSQAIPSAVVTTLNSRLSGYGYTAAPVSGAPPYGADVALRLAWFNNSYSYYYSWCAPYYYGWYGCWPTYGYAGSYSTGTVAMLMVDLRAARPPNPPITNPAELPVLWATGLYAVLRGTTPDNTNVFNQALNRAFDQSPYLDTH